MWLTVANHRLFIALNYYGLASFVSGSAEKGQNFLRTLYIVRFVSTIETNTVVPQTTSYFVCCCTVSFDSSDTRGGVGVAIHRIGVGSRVFQKT